MSEEIKGLADVELRDLSKDTLEKQIQQAQQLVQQYEQQILQLQNQIQQQIGVAGFAQHLLTKFKIAEKPKEDPKKATPLEVK